MIPRIFHRIWIPEHPGDVIPPEHEAFWERFKELHPSWQFQTWHDAGQLDWLRYPETYAAQPTHAGRSDVLRYEILAEFGGVYVDCDVEPLRPFDDLLGDTPFAGWEDARLLCPTVMGSPPGHPAVEDLVEALPQHARNYRRQPPNVATGPMFLTKRWRRRPDVRLLPPAAFYPVHWSEKASLGGPYPPESYAVHHWAAGWLPGGPPQRAPVRA